MRRLKEISRGAGIVAQWVKLALAMPTSYIGILVGDPAVLLLIQHPAKVPGKMVDDDLCTWAPNTRR